MHRPQPNPTPPLFVPVCKTLPFSHHSKVISINHLHHHAGGRTTAIANRSTPILALLQLMQQCDQDACAGATDGVAKRYRAAAGVDLLDVDVEDLRKREGSRIKVS